LLIKYKISVFFFVPRVSPFFGSGSGPAVVGWVVSLGCQVSGELVGGLHGLW